MLIFCLKKCKKKNRLQKCSQLQFYIVTSISDINFNLNTFLVLPDGTL